MVAKALPNLVLDKVTSLGGWLGIRRNDVSVRRMRGVAPLALTRATAATPVARQRTAGPLALRATKFAHLGVIFDDRTLKALEDSLQVQIVQLY